MGPDCGQKTPLAGFDPFDPEQAGRHHEVMAELRAKCPVARLSSGMVAVTRYPDVREALNAPTMRNSHAGRAPGTFVPPEDRLFFFEYDPPEHSALRRLLVDLLSRPQAERKAPAMRILAEELLYPILKAGSGELVHQFSIPFAGRLMMQVAGFPENDAPRWRAWIQEMVLSGFSFTNRNERGVGFAQCYPDILSYLDGHLMLRAESERQPDDVLTRVVGAQLDGIEPLTRTQKRMILFSVVSAGTNTLVNFVSNTFLSLARDTGLVETLRRDRSLVPMAVEESLRRDSPSMYITRMCAQTARVGGVSIAAGEKLLLGLASANRDESVYPQPEAFRLDRDKEPPHVAFGWGGHLCLGAWIARQAGVAILDALLDTVGTLELVPGRTPRPYLSPQGNGLDELPVRLSRLV
jgi:cytochrome P450